MYAIRSYYVSRNIKAGIGAGIHLHNEGTLFPLYLDARYSLSAQDLVPCIAAAGGIAIDPKVIDRITSYNVCYTKLLRGYSCHPLCYRSGAGAGSRLSRYPDDHLPEPA